MSAPVDCAVAVEASESTVRRATLKRRVFNAVVHLDLQQTAPIETFPRPEPDRIVTQINPLDTMNTGSNGCA